MNTPTVAALFLAFAPALLPGQSMEERYAEKMQAPFLKKVAWARDFEAVKAAAAKEGKLIFGYFTRSFAP